MRNAEVDSLKNALRSLHYQVDSLQGVTTKFEAKISSFDQIIYLQLTVFIVIITVIVGIAALVTWSSFAKPFTNRLNNFEAKLQDYSNNKRTDLEAQKSELVKYFAKKIKELDKVKSNAQKAMYLVTKNEKMWGTTLVWIFSIITEDKSLENNQIKTWLSLAMNSIEKLIAGESTISPSSRKKIENCLSLMSKSQDEGVNKRLNKFRAKYYSYIEANPINNNA